MLNRSVSAAQVERNMVLDPRTGHELEGVDHCCATATTIQFVNKCPGPVDVLWQNAKGERAKYMTLQENCDYEQATYVGHLWVIMYGDTHVHSCVGLPGHSIVSVLPLEPDHKPVNDMDGVFGKAALQLVSKANVE